MNFKGRLLTEDSDTPGDKMKFYSKEFKQRFGVKPTECDFGQIARKLGSYVGNIRD